MVTYCNKNEGVFFLIIIIKSTIDLLNLQFISLSQLIFI